LQHESSGSALASVVINSKLANHSQALESVREELHRCLSLRKSSVFFFAIEKCPSEVILWLS
jgi:hypothetical protein